MSTENIKPSLRAVSLGNLGTNPAPKEWQGLLEIAACRPQGHDDHVALMELEGRVGVCAWFTKRTHLWTIASPFFLVHREYEVWSGNWQDGPNSYNYTLLGTAIAKSFSKACKAVCGKRYARVGGIDTVLGVRLFETQALAAQSSQESGYLKIPE